MERPRHYLTLDAMRGVAALCVVVFHFRWLLFTDPPAISFFPDGRLAVDLFFLLSGFVIASAYDPKLSAGMSIGAFLKARFIRLLPMIWVGCTIGAALLLASEGMSTPEVMLAWALNTIILPYPATRLFPTNGPEWSLMYEMIANVGFVVAYPLLTRRNLCVMIAIGFCAAILLTLRFGYLRHETGLAGPAMGLTRVGFSFLLGVLLSRTRQHWRSVVPRVPVWTLLLATVLLLCIAGDGLWRSIYTLVFVAIISPAVVALASVLEPSGKGSIIAKAAGDLSYPIYIIHAGFRDWTFRICGDNGVPSPAVAIGVILALIPISLLLARHYDAPVRGYLTRRLTRQLTPCEGEQRRFQLPSRWWRTWGY